MTDTKSSGVDLSSPASASASVNQGPRQHFFEELEELKGRVLAMGELAEGRVRAALQALVDRNREALADVIAVDARLHQLQREIDDRCLTLLALYQPVAIDLRTIVSAFKINADLARVGDLGVNIGHAAQRYVLHPPVKPLIDLPRMGHVALKMLREALDAFVSRDVSVAQAVLTQDDWVDALKNQILRELLTYMLGDRQTIEPSVDLILISRHIERVGDHATNIAEDVIFIVEGRDIRHRAALVPANGAASGPFVERRKTRRAPLL